MKNGIVATLLLGALFVAGCLKQEPPGPLALPEFDRAVFEDSRDHSSREIDDGQCGKLREVFRSVTVDRHPAKWQVCGNLALYKGETFLVRVRLFGDPPSIGAFRYDGKYFRGYDQKLFRSLDWRSRSSAGSLPELKFFKGSNAPFDPATAIPFSESLRYDCRRASLKTRRRSGAATVPS